MFYSRFWLKVNLPLAFDFPLLVRLSARLLVGAILKGHRVVAPLADLVNASGLCLYVPVNGTPKGRVLIPFWS